MEESSTRSRAGRWKRAAELVHAAAGGVLVGAAIGSQTWAFAYGLAAVLFLLGALLRGHYHDILATPVKPQQRGQV